MTLTTATYWTINGIDLNQYCWNIATLGGDRIAAPPLRGANIVIPGVAGGTWMPKVVDQRTLSLGMWVQGSNADGTIPTGNAADAFWANWRVLRNALWTYNKQVQITKRFYIGSTLITAKALGQFSGGLSPEMTGNSHAILTVDFTLSDPYFYADPVTVQLTAADASHTTSLSINGDTDTTNITFEVDGARGTPKVHSNTLNADWTWSGTLASGDITKVDVRAYTAQTSIAGGIYNDTSGSITHSGATPWFILTPGNNEIVASSTTGTGLISMTYREAYF